VSEELLRLAIEGHGGEAAWRDVSALDMRYTAGGLAFVMKWRGVGRQPFDAHIDTARPWVTLRSFPRPGRRGILDGHAVRIETDGGDLVASRDRPADEYRRPRRLLWWDDMDFLYFAAYAMWGYATFPFHLTHPGTELDEIEPWHEDGDTWRRLRVRYPDDLPVHSREQVFHLDDRGLLRRQDYTAEAFGRWARATHYCYDHRTFDGLAFPTRRRIHPRRGDGRPRRAVNIISIDVESVKAERAA
jgi:hypothetical protein